MANEERRWHDWKPIIESEKDEVERRALIKLALSEPYVKRKDGLLFQSNDHGNPHDCMSQVDMAQVLLRNGVKYGVPSYLDDGERCLKTVTTKVSAGGLRKPGGDKDVAWFHGVTSQTTEFPGWTLNKHLHGVYGLFECADIVRSFDRSLAESWDKWGLRGLRQLDIGNPCLKDYIVPGDSPRSWLYYSRDSDNEEGRFLTGTDGIPKNGAYHLYVMGLIVRCDESSEGQFNWGGLRGEFRRIMESYKIKLKEGLYVDSKPCAGGNYRGIADTKMPLSDRFISWWNAHI